MLGSLIQFPRRKSRKQLEYENAALREQLRLLKTHEDTQCHQGERDTSVNALMTMENQLLKAGLTDIQGNLANAVNSVKASMTDVHQLSMSFETLRHSAMDVMAEVQECTQQSSDSATSVETMLRSTDEIAGVLDEIKSISTQINMISLNASVEAARAGESGRGFAVVAKEVKNLSDKTRKSLQEIERVVGAIITQVNSVARNTERMHTLGETSATRVRGFCESLAQMNSTLTHDVTNITTSNENVFLGLAKLDHMIWNVNTYLSINIREAAFPFVDHHNCRLGKWYEEGDGKTYYASTPAHKSLVRPHANVHNLTQDVLKELQKNELNYSRITELMGEMATESESVLRILSEFAKSRKPS